MTHTSTAPATQPHLAAPHLRRSPRRLRWSLLVLLGCAATAVALSLSRHEQRAPLIQPLSVSGDRIDIKPDAPTWGYIELTQATLGDPVAPPPVPGRVAVDDAGSTSVVAPLPGRVDSIAVRLGQQVQQGERLLSVRSAALVDLFRQIDLLKAKEAARTKAADRIRTLVQLKAAPEKDLITAEEELRQSRLAHEAAETKLRSLAVAAANEGLYWVTAPRPGVVVERNVMAGQEAGPDRSEPLLVVAELGEVIVTADVPEADLVGLQTGQTATVVSAAAPEQVLTGTVEYIGEIVDPVHRMVNVRVRVPNANRTLRPNAFVQVTFTPAGRPIVLAAADAVVTDDQRSFVFVQMPDRPASLERRPVVTGPQREGKVEVLKGLEPGERYISKGALLLLNAIDLAS